MRPFIASGWENILRSNGMASFDEIWNLEAPYVDQPNIKRDGRSYVSRLTIEAPDSQPITLYIKRQENYFLRTPRHPFRGILRLENELENINKYHRHGISTMTPVFCQVNQTSRSRRGILIIRELEGYIPLDKIIDDQNRHHGYPPSIRKKITVAISNYLNRVHHCRMCHNCLYPKHIFLKFEVINETTTVESIKVCFIDLEKNKTVLRRNTARIKDLDTLNRHSGDIENREKIRFLLSYLGTGKNKSSTRKFLYRLRARHRKKL